MFQTCFRLFQTLFWPCTTLDTIGSKEPNNSKSSSRSRSRSSSSRSSSSSSSGSSSSSSGSSSGICSSCNVF